MTEMQRYLAEEVAEDLADGIISRREALRRLGLLGVTGTVAAGLLAAAGNAAAAAREDSDNQGRSASGSETVWAPVAREAITFAGPAGPLMAAWAPASKPRGGVLVIHENRGLTEHISTIAGRLAASGYSALALDLLSQDNHAFFNDTGARFNPHAAAEAWRRALNWFDAADDRHDD